MRAYVPAFDLMTPKSLDAALALLKEGGWKPFAGGTDLMVLFEAGMLPPGKFVNLWPLDELRGIVFDGTHVVLGALTTYSEVLADKRLAKEFPLLGRAARETGAVAIQNRGTLGGNIGNASPAADTPPALLVYEADIELVSSGGSRWVPYLEFHTAYKKTMLRPDELIARIRLPRTTKGAHQYYRKVGTRRAQAISKVCCAGVAFLEGKKLKEVRLAFGSVAPKPIRCPNTETWLEGKGISPAIVKDAQARLLLEIAPIDDIRSDAAYRKHVAAGLLSEFLCGIGSQN